MGKQHILHLIIVTGLLMMATGTAFAGAWTMEKGKSYHRMAANYYLADENFDDNGHDVPMSNSGEFTDANISYYVEYGLMDPLTIILALYYKNLQKEDDLYEYDTWGFGDTDLGLRYRLLNNNIGIVSIQGLVKIPELYDENDDLPEGNGQYDFECRLLYGRSLWPVLPMYINLEAAYRFRADEPADEFRYLIETGGNLGKNFSARAKWDAIISMENADNETDAYGNPTSSIEYDLSKLDLTLGWQMTPKWGLELTSTPAIIGKNTAKGVTWTIAFTYQPKNTK